MKGDPRRRTIIAIVILMISIVVICVIGNFPRGKVINVDTYLREEPSWSAEKDVIVNVGKTVYVLSTDGDWYHCYYKGDVGYLPKKNVVLINN